MFERWERELAADPEWELLGEIARSGHLPQLVDTSNGGPPPSITPNGPTARGENEAKLRASVEEQLRKGQVVPNGSFGVQAIVINALHVVRKLRLGRWKDRRITDHSQPRGSSVNDFPAFEKLFKFTTIEEAAALIEPNMLLQGFDYRDFYRALPLHPADWPYFAFQVGSEVFLDLHLSFGSKLAPAMAETLSKAIVRCLNKKGHVFKGYLDDLLCLSRSEEEALAARDAFRDLSSDLGLTEAIEKYQAPTTQLVWLGIQLDSVAMKASLPADRLATLLEEVRETRAVGRLTGRALESLIGHLSHACKILPAGRGHLESLYKTLHVLQKSIPLMPKATSSKGPPQIDRRHFTWRAKLHTLNKQCLQELDFFSSLLPIWNGSTDLMQARPRLPTSAATDASDTYGIGWCFAELIEKQPWSALGSEASEAVKLKGGIAIGELLAVLALLVRFGRLWIGQRVPLAVDSQVAIGGIKKGRVSGDKVGPLATKVARAIQLIAAMLHITLEPYYIPSKANPADAPSRDQTGTLAQSLRHECDLQIPELSIGLPGKVRDFVQQTELVLENSLLSPQFVSFIFAY